MTTEVTRRSELAEFVSDHVFSYVNGKYYKTQTVKEKMYEYTGKSL